MHFFFCWHQKVFNYPITSFWHFAKSLLLNKIFVITVCQTSFQCFLNSEKREVEMIPNYEVQVPVWCGGVGDMAKN